MISVGGDRRQQYPEKLKVGSPILFSLTILTTLPQRTSTLSRKIYNKTFRGIMEACNQCECQDTEAISFPSRSDDRYVLFEANIRNQSRSNEAILLSRTADRSYLFKASNDCMISILSYLSMKNICQLDIAVTNTAARVIWLSS